MGDNFYLSKRGAKFFDCDVPMLNRNLERLAEVQDAANRLKTIELFGSKEKFVPIENVTPFNLRKTIWYDFSDFNNFLSLMFSNKYIAVYNDENKFEIQTVNGSNRNVSTENELNEIYRKLEKYYGGMITINGIHSDNNFGIWIYYTEKNLADEFK